MTGNGIKAGTKFYRYKEGVEEPEIIRIRNIDITKDKVGYYDSSWKKLSMSYGELRKKYSMLRPDGIIMFSIVKVSEVSDVIVSLNKLDLDNTDHLPYAVCRQSIYDFFANMTTAHIEGALTCVGISVSKDTCPADINFTDVLACDSIEFNKPVSVYLDDTLDDILRFIKLRKFDDVLKELKKASIMNFRGQVEIDTYKETLRDLLTSNYFMYDFRRCFKIIEVPFYIDGNKDTLDQENIQFLNKELNANIMETYLIKYTREIDLRSIKRDYVLISSAVGRFSEVYILGYDEYDN